MVNISFPSYLKRILFLVCVSRNRIAKPYSQQELYREDRHSATCAKNDGCQSLKRINAYSRHLNRLLMKF